MYHAACRVHRTTHDQEFNAQRLQTVLSVKFLRQKDSMLFQSRERKELIQIREKSWGRPFDVQLKQLPNILTNSGESLTR